MRSKATRLGRALFRHRGILPVPLVLLALARGLSDRGCVPAGLVVGALGEGLRLWAVGHIGSRSRTRGDEAWGPCRSGPYGHVRNPLYLGNLLLWAGLALAVDVVLLPVFLVPLALHYALVVRWEEAHLERSLGEPYRRYLLAVPRWVPALRSAGEPGRWNGAEALRSERPTLLALAAVAAALALRSRVPW